MGVEDMSTAYNEWAEAAERLAACAEELLNAVSQRNQARILECKRWTHEALGSESAARRVMTRALGLQQAMR